MAFSGSWGLTGYKYGVFAYYLYITPGDYAVVFSAQYSKKPLAAEYYYRFQTAVAGIDLYIANTA